MNRSIPLLCIAASFLALGGKNEASAQAFVPRGGSSYNMTRNFLYNRPTVSPYLNLTTRDAVAGLPNYFTMVRPQVEMREQESMRQRQSAQMQQQLNQVQDQVRNSQQQAAGMMLTGQMGWSARGMPRFGSHMSYYPGFRAIGR
jgi:hypothetical protein